MTEYIPYKEELNTDDIVDFRIEFDLKKTCQVN